MDIFQNEFHLFAENYKGKGYKKGAKVKGAGTVPGDVNVMKGLYMPKPMKGGNAKAAAKITVPGDVNASKAAMKGVPGFNTKNVNKGHNSQSVSMANLPNSKKSNTASFGNKGPHNNTFSNNAVRDHQEHGGMNLWEAKKKEAKKKMKKEKPNDPISKTTVKAPWTKMTVPGDVAIGVNNQGKEYTAHTGPDYAKNSDYGKQRKVSYGSETKNFYDHLERGELELIEVSKDYDKDDVKTAKSQVRRDNEGEGWLYSDEDPVFKASLKGELARGTKEGAYKPRRKKKVAINHETGRKNK